MNNLLQKAIVGLLQLMIGIGFMLFVPAWTFDFWQAWVYVFVFSTSVVLIFFYLYNKDPKLLERRLQRTEKEKNQKLIQFYIYVTYIGIFILSSLDHRFCWSNVPFIAVMTGDVLLALGYFIIFVVLKENTFAASIIEMTPEHKVISAGPYIYIRHPMYFGAIIIVLGTPLALGSWWGLLLFFLMVFIIVWRLLEEENFLSQNLSGYKEYCQKVKHRLVPFIW